MADDYRNGKKNFQFVFAGDDLVNSSRSQKGWVFFFQQVKKCIRCPQRPQNCLLIGLDGLGFLRGATQ